MDKNNVKYLEIYFKIYQKIKYLFETADFNIDNEIYIIFI